MKSVRSLCMVLSLFALCSLLVASTAGCGGRGGPNTGTVTGVVTLDGQPLPNAQVNFYPSEGRASTGTTDETGTYELMFTATEEGAVPGQHSVEISTAIAESDEQGAAIAEELVPVKYNKKTTLTATVKAGKQSIPFDLTTQ